MIDRPIKKGISAQGVRTPQVDHPVHGAVDQLRDIAQAATSQKEHDAKMLAVAISSAAAMRDVWEQKAKRWQRAMWGFASIGMIACIAIGLVAWKGLQQLNRQQSILRHDMVKRDDELHSLQFLLHERIDRDAGMMATAPSAVDVEQVISRTTEKVNMRFDTLALSVETLLQQVNDLARKQNGLLSATTHLLHKWDTNSDASTRLVTHATNASTDLVEASEPVAIHDESQEAKVATVSIRLLQSRPVNHTGFTNHLDKAALPTWHLSGATMNPSGLCIPRKPST